MNMTAIRFRRLCLTISLVLAALTEPAAAVESSATALFGSPPPGRFASLGTHRLYYHCSGSQGPTVVIDAGLGGSAVEWSEVQTALSQEHRVCSYDRAGYAWSDTGPAPRTADVELAELVQLLEAIGEPPPYLLVGHSYGGFIMRLFAARAPDMVAGLVLVDSSHPDEIPQTGTAAPGQPMQRNALDVKRFEADFDELPPALAQSMFLNSRRKAVFAQMDELAGFSASAALVAASGRLGNLPLVVLSRDHEAGSDASQEAHWHELQRSLAALSASGELRIISGSGHNLHVTHPRAVTAAVDSVAALAAQRAEVTD
jgi:pimeloyl-ACP methyl ester carboxylesterase